MAPWTLLGSLQGQHDCYVSNKCCSKCGSVSEDRGPAGNVGGFQQNQYIQADVVHVLFLEVVFCCVCVSLWCCLGLPEVGHEVEPRGVREATPIAVQQSYMRRVCDRSYASVQHSLSSSMGTVWIPFSTHNSTLRHNAANYLGITLAGQWRASRPPAKPPCTLDAEEANSIYVTLYETAQATGEAPLHT